MKINTIQFHVTTSHNIKFKTAKTLSNGTINNKAKEIRKIIGIYSMGNLFGTKDPCGWAI